MGAELVVTALFLHEHLEPSFRGLALSHVAAEFSFSIIMTNVGSSTFGYELKGFLFVNSTTPCLDLVLKSVVLCDVSAVAFTAVVDITEAVIIPVVVI